MSRQSQLEAQATELHRRNLKMLGPGDVVVVGYPGSGSALVANALLELGFDYLDLYTEMLTEDGGSVPVPGLTVYRNRLRAMAERDRAGQRPAGGDRLRFAKDSLFPQEHADLDLAGVVLLVRDPRDAVHSSYQWFRGFSPIFMADAPKAQDSFAEFLDGVGIGEEPPIPQWAAFYGAWLEALPDFRASIVIRFEDLKADTVGSMTRLLETFGVQMDRSRIEEAVRRSDFAAMREHEDREAAGLAGGGEARINRRGKVGEWREWYGDPDLAARFQEPDLLHTAARFGYEITPPAVPSAWAG